jgi:DNA-binding transcriptional LysR family regulator
MEREGTFVPTRRLVAFLAVLEHGGVSRAAERLGVRQPTVSGLIRSLERDVGTDLFVRRPGPLRPTAAGTALATHAARLLKVVEEATEAVARADRDARRHLAIAAGEALATHVLPPAVARLRERLPGLTVEFVVGDEARVVEALRSGEVDAALLTDRTEARDFEMHDYQPGRLVLVAAPSHRLVGRPRVGWRDLAGETLVVRDAGTINRREVEQMLTAAGVAPKSRLVASSLEAVKRCAEAGLGVTVVPQIAVERELAEERLVELRLDAPGLEYRFVLATRRGETPPPTVTALLELLRAP